MTIETHDNLHEYFRILVREASERRYVPLPSSVEIYLAQLLTQQQPKRSDSDGETMVHGYLRALEAPDKSERFRRLRSLGDMALHHVGWFVEGLRHRGVSRRYVVDMGTRAYREAHGIAQGGLLGTETRCHHVLREIAGRFSCYANLLDEARECTTMKTPQDIVRLYDRWRRTGSPLLADRLRQEGVFPQASSSKLVH